MDVYFKLRALHRLGYQIILHSYQYRQNTENAHLEELCEQVYYYNRRRRLTDFLSPLPYIVVSRQNPELLTNLQQNDAPILFEGLHCCSYLQHSTLRERSRVVRMHNIEWKYYEALADQEKHPLKRLHFRIESNKLKKYESEVLRGIPILAINPEENRYLLEEGLESQTIEAFHPYDEPEYHPDKQKMVLFHGSLDVHENINSALWIIDELAAHTPEIQYCIAGKRPDVQIVKRAENHPNVTVVADPDVEELQGLICQAQINLIITFQNTGIKLKLLNALFVGGYCIANTPAVYASELDEQVLIADDPEKIRSLIRQYIETLFTRALFDQRKNKIMIKYNNQVNAEKITRIIYP